MVYDGIRDSVKELILNREFKIVYATPVPRFFGFVPNPPVFGLSKPTGAGEATVIRQDAGKDGPSTLFLSAALVDLFRLSTNDVSPHHSLC